MVSSQSGYVAIPTSDTDSGVGSSRHASASSSLSSSPLQHATATLYPLPSHDQPYELSEKKQAAWHTHAAKSPFQDPYTPDSGEAKTLLRSAAGWIQRCKTTVLVCVCIVLATMVLLRDHRASSPPPASPSTNALVAPSSTTTTSPTLPPSTPPTPAYRLEDDMVLITKVGSATVHKRLLIHLAEQPRSHLYMPNQLYVSDYALQLGNITLYDALANVTSTISALPEFRSLRGELQALLESNQNLDDMSSKDAGWKLDKYKFLPAVAEAWRRFPGKKWYVLVEADTFVFWDEMVKWLGRLDEGEQYLLGHPSFCDYDGKSTMFTHGGSGIVMSRALVEASFGSDAEFEHTHDELIQASAFGDALLSKAIYDSPRVHLTELSPEGGERFNSDPPRVLKFVRGTWCKPILTFHHITPTDAVHMYDFQRRITPLLPANDTVRWADVWDEFTPHFLKQAMEQVGRFHNDHSAQFVDPATGAEPGEVAIVDWQAFEDWDSETTDVVTPSADECQRKCRQDANCLMWEWRKKGDGWPEQEWAQNRKRDEQARVWGKCRYTTEFLRIGLTKPKADDELTTGWMGSRIDRWRREQVCSGRTGLNGYD